MRDSADRLLHASSLAFKEYILENYDSWCQFALTKKRDPEDPEFEGPVLVRGWVKTSDWDVVTWIKANRSQKLTVAAGFRDYLQGGASVSRSVGFSSGVHHRFGPPKLQGVSPGSGGVMDVHQDLLDGCNPPRDQCVFVSYFKVKKRLLLPRKIEAAAGIYKPPGNDRPESPPYDIGIYPEASEVSIQVDGDLILHIH